MLTINMQITVIL